MARNTVDRRSFFGAVARCATLMGLPAWMVRTSDPAPAQQVEEELPVPGELGEQIRHYESYLRSAGAFSWHAHNELRHLYGRFSQRRSLEQIELILAHSLLDDYMLDILSGWQLDQAQASAVAADLAIASLVLSSEQNPTLYALQAACLIKAGDLCRAYGREREACELYRRATALRGGSGASARALRQYRPLAQRRLSLTQPL